MFRLEAKDIGKDYLFYIDRDRVVMDFRGERKPDVIMKGDFETLLKLFLHKADADSIFFSRKVIVRGDVKTSVFFKNLLEHL